jgi:hypothetical protein
VCTKLARAQRQLSELVSALAARFPLAGMASQEDALAVAEPAPLTLAALPHELLLEVLSRLPVDCRLRCAEVYRSWRTAANDPTLWRRLDLSPATGGLARAASDGLFRAASARARGQLESLHVSGCCNIRVDTLMDVVRANRASLHELHMHECSWRRWAIAEVEELLSSAPLLRACHAAMHTHEVEVARAMLRAEPPFAALRLETLSVGDEDNEDKEILKADAVLELAADLAACTFIRRLVLWDAALDAPAALDALVDAALTRRLHTLPAAQRLRSARSVGARFGASAGRRRAGGAGDC